MNKICLIYQPCGFGDILFAQKIAKHYIDKGYQIVWPVIEEYDFLKDYIPEIHWVSWEDKKNFLTHNDKLPDNIQFPKKEFYDPYLDHIFTDEFIYINGFKPIGNNRVMAFKYDNIGMSYYNWADYVKFNRNTEKENELFYNVLGIKDGEEYVFVNRQYQIRPTPQICERISLDPSHYSGKRVVELQILPEFSAFDWCKVIENASEINMIETSLNYILESPQIRHKIFNKPLSLYSRYNNFSEVDYLFQLPWNYKR